MITTKDVHGPNNPDDADSIFVTLKANNGTSAKYSLFALNLKQVPDKLEHQGRTYERTEGNTLEERAAKASPAQSAPPPTPAKPVAQSKESPAKPKHK